MLPVRAQNLTLNVIFDLECFTFTFGHVQAEMLGAVWIDGQTQLAGAAVLSGQG